VPLQIKPDLHYTGFLVDPELEVFSSVIAGSATALRQLAEPQTLLAMSVRFSEHRRGAGLE